MSTAFMMRNRQLNRGLICLNIINDADLSDKTQAHSRECLQMATRLASAADVPMQTQTRLAVNFVTATIHALRENDASELLIGMHRKRHEGDSFLGLFAQGLIDNMSRQLIIVDMHIPANTIRKIVVAVPEKAEYEKGFYRWINRIARMAEDLGCQMDFYATEATGNLIMRYMRDRHKSVRDDYELLYSWNDFPALRHELNPPPAPDRLCRHKPHAHLSRPAGGEQRAACLHRSTPLRSQLWQHPCRSLAQQVDRRNGMRRNRRMKKMKGDREHQLCIMHYELCIQ